MKNIITTFAVGTILSTALFLQSGKPVYALQTVSATLEPTVIVVAQNKNSEVEILRAYLEQKNSPLADYAEVFVEEAKANELDWRLVAAISGVESSFGLRIPYNSYNGWGWGVYGTNVIRFESWDDAIRTISRSLKKKYVDRGAKDITAIGKIYAADPNWSVKVSSFMNQMEKFTLKKKATTIALSL